MNPKGVIIVLILLFLLYLINYGLMVSDLNNSMKISSISIGIFIVLNSNNDLQIYEQHLSSLSCYAHRHSYELILMHVEQYPICTNRSQSIFFQKHCLVTNYLVDHVHIQWLLVLDIDVLVLNLSKKIESYLPQTRHESSISLIFYEKFNGEIASGNYLIRNHPWSHTFLSRWIEYERYIPYIKYHNNDNGVLHIHLLDPMVSDVNQSNTKHCFDLYKGANELRAYHTFIACCKCALAGRWEFEHVRILRRGHSFIRENFGHYLKKRIWSPTDFLLHGQKQHVEEFYSNRIDRNLCQHPQWVLPLREDAILMNFTQVKETISQFDQAAAQGYPQSVGLPEITDCWPYCRENETRRQAFLDKVCHINAIWRTFQ